MARVAVTVAAVRRSGNNITTLPNAADAQGHYMDNDGRTFLVINNANAGTVVVTVQTPRTVDGLAVAELTLSMGAGTRWILGPFPTATFNQSGSDRGRIYIDFDITAGVTLGGYRLG